MWVFLTALILTLCACVGLLLRYAPFESVITPAQKKTAALFYVSFTVVNMAVLMASLYAWGLDAAFLYMRFGSILYAVIMMIVNILVIPNRGREHLFVFGVVITFHFLLLSVPNYVITFLPGYDNMVYLFVVLVLYSFLLVLTYFPLRGMLRRTVEPLLHAENGEYWNTIWLTPVAFFGTKFISLGGRHDPGSVNQLLSSALYVGVIILICASIRADHKRIRAHQLLEQQLAGQRVHYAELKARVEEARKTNHDFKHHITAIRHYVDVNDRQGLLDYCNDLLGRTATHGRIPYTGNGAADGVLYHYMQRAEAMDIDFRIAGTIHSSGIADADLCVLLGNALDNALTACQTIDKDRSIAVISQSQPQMLSIMIRNTFNGHVERAEDTLLSTKRPGCTGVGLTSMDSVCRRYGGSMEIQWDSGTFTVMFLLPLSEEE